MMKFLKNPARSCALLLALSLPSFYFSGKLYSNLRSSLYELLPQDAPSYVDFQELRGRLPGREGLNIVINCGEPAHADCPAYQARLSEKISTRGLEARYQEDTAVREFLDRHFGLMIQTKDLEVLRDRLADEASRSDLLGLETESDSSPSIESIYQKYAGLLASTKSWPDGRFVTDDLRWRAVLVPVRDPDLTVARAFEVRRLVDRAISEAPAPTGMSVHFSGGVQTLIEEHEALMKDLILATLITLVLVALSLYWFFRDWFACGALILNLLVGAAWCFGISYFTVGYLNSNTAFLGAIVLGNGINFGIILVARYFELLREGLTPDEALVEASRQSRRATSLAALGAALAYGSLIATDFRGFNQFGIVGFTGMVTCWLATYSLLPALLRWGTSQQWIHMPDQAPTLSFDRLSQLVVKHARATVRIGFVLTAIGAVCLVSLFHDRIETDISKLRSEKSLESGSAYYANFVNQIFGRYLSPMVIRDNSPTPRTVDLAHELREGQLNLAAIYTLQDFEPQDQEARQELLSEIQNLLSPSLIRSFPENQRLAFEKIDQSTFAPYRSEDIPKTLRSNFEERDGETNRLVLLEPKITKENWNGDAILALVDRIREISSRTTQDFSFSGSFPLTSDLYRAILNDGPRATLVSIALIFLLLAVGLRNFRALALSMLGLSAGVLWLCIFIVAFDFRINFLNFIVFPITFGISVDYAVNILCRWRNDPTTPIQVVIRETGGAVFLCSLTTMIGYGSLILADNQALQSFGWLSVIGEMTSLLATTLFIPAWIILGSPRELTAVNMPEEQQRRVAS